MEVPVVRPSQPARATLPGVVENPHGGYQIHVQVQGSGPALIHQPHQAVTSAPPGTPVLARMSVFEDCVLLELQDGQTLVVHASDPQAAGTVVFFYHPVLVLNRLLAPCALRHVAQWVADTGLHLLLGLPDPTAFSYDRLADALLAVYPHWQTIAAELTLQAVAQFQLAVETIHYDLTSVLFHGEYADSAWVEFGYSRDKRPDKRQINLGLSTTADGEVVLPGGSGIHAGNTTDVTTTVPTHQRLHHLFQRSDLLVTGDRIMQSAGNMLVIARAHGRFLGPVDWTPYIRRVVAGCPAADFVELPYSTQAGHTIKATARHLRFKVKEELSDEARKRLAQQRQQRGQRGRTPKYRKVHFWVRAAIIWDTARQEADAARRLRRLVAYEADLQWTHDHLNQGRYYGDPEWVAGHLADLAAQYPDVRSFIKVTFSQREGHMSLAWQRRAAKIAQACPERSRRAASLDGKWVLVTNQPPTPGQSPRDYLDWTGYAVRVYKNHGQVEHRMRNSKSDLPLRPLYLHRDDEIVALCFIGVVALMVYTLIERDCQACPPLVAAGLRTAARVLTVLHGFCLTVFQTPAGVQVFWLDTPNATQMLLWRQLAVDDPGTRLPTVRLAA